MFLGVEHRKTEASQPRKHGTSCAEGVHGAAGDVRTMHPGEVVGTFKAAMKAVPVRDRFASVRPEVRSGSLKVWEEVRRRGHTAQEKQFLRCMTGARKG